jgi:hypothetical protein
VKAMFTSCLFNLLYYSWHGHMNRTRTGTRYLSPSRSGQSKRAPAPISIYSVGT